MILKERQIERSRHREGRNERERESVNKIVIDMMDRQTPSLTDDSSIEK